MKTKILAFSLAILGLLALGGHTAVVSAQAANPFPVAAYVSADDSDVALLVRYVGTATSADVAVDAGTGDLTFRVSAAAYTGFECPIAAPLGGVIDVSNAACDTMGEVVDIINGYCTGCSSDFRAVLVDSMRADSSNDTIVTIGATEVTLIDGLALNIDTSVAFIESRALIPERTMKAFMSPQGRVHLNPQFGTQGQLFWMEGYSTYGAGTSLMEVYSVKSTNKVGAPGSEGVTTLWSEDAGATTVNKQLTQFQFIKPRARPHEKLIVRITNSAAMATVRLLANGEIGAVGGQ